MSDDVDVKKNLTIALLSVQVGIENLQKILGGENPYLGELVIQSIKGLAEEERKLNILLGFMDKE